MRYKTVKTLKDADFKCSTGVQRRTFEQMLTVIERGLRDFGRPPKLSRTDQSLMMFGIGASIARSFTLV